MMITLIRKSNFVRVLATFLVSLLSTFVVNLLEVPLTMKIFILLTPLPSQRASSTNTPQKPSFLQVFDPYIASTCHTNRRNEDPTVHSLVPVLFSFLPVANLVKPGTFPDVFHKLFHVVFPPFLNAYFKNLVRI